MTTSGPRSRRSTTTRGAAKGKIKRISEKKAYRILCDCMVLAGKIEEKVNRLKAYSDYAHPSTFDEILDNLDEVYNNLSMALPDMDTEEV